MPILIPTIATRENLIDFFGAGPRPAQPDEVEGVGGSILAYEVQVDESLTLSFFTTSSLKCLKVAISTQKSVLCSYDFVQGEILNLEYEDEPGRIIRTLFVHTGPTVLKIFKQPWILKVAHEPAFAEIDFGSATSSQQESSGGPG